jgi:hypothetical protein
VGLNNAVEVRPFGDGPTEIEVAATDVGLESVSTAGLGDCDAPGFHPGSLTLTIESNELTLVKRWSTWVITSKTSPTTPNESY